MTKRLVAVAALCVVSACTPDQMSTFLDVTAPAREAAEQRGLTSDRFDRLAECESGAQPDAVSKSGKYRGLAQFDQSTWDAVTGRWYPWLTGQDPAAVEHWWQVAATWALWAERGAAPWPNCGAK